MTLTKASKLAESKSLKHNGDYPSYFVVDMDYQNTRKYYVVSEDYLLTDEFFAFDGIIHQEWNNGNLVG